MKIVISSNSSWNIYNFRLGLIKELLNKNHELYLAVKSDKFAKNLEKLGCNIIDLNISPRSRSIFSNLKIINKYFKIFKNIKPDFYLGFTIKPNILGNIAAFFFNIKIINNVTGLGTTFIKKNYLTLLIIVLYFFAFKKSNKVFFQNNNDLNLFLKLKIINKKKCSVIPGSGINYKNYKYENNYKIDNKIKFLYFGRMLVDKGLNELINVSKEIKKNYTNVSFELIGEFENSKENLVLKNTIIQNHNLGNIIYREFKENIHKYIINSDCVILPSYREGLPRSLLEAAMFKKPVITTDVPGCNEIVKNNFNGLVCKSKNSQSLYDSVLKFIKLDKNIKIKLGNNNYKFIKRNYDENLVIAKYLIEII